MRQSLLVSLALLAACSPSAVSSDPEKEVLERFETLAQAAKDLDHDRYLSHFDKERFSALNADGSVTHTFAEFEEGYLSGMSAIARYNSLEFSNVKVTLVGKDTAILVNEYEADVELSAAGPVGLSGAGTQVWQQIDNEWKLVSVSSAMKTDD